MSSNPIDQEKLRPIRDAIRKLLIDDVVPGHLHDARDILWNLYNSLDTLTPKSTMADTEWSDAEHHLAEAEHEVESRLVMLDYLSGPDLIVCHNLDNGQTYRSRRDSLTPTDRKFRLVPENAAPTPDQAPGETSYNPSSEVSADPNPGEAWLTDHKYPNMIRTEYGWRGQHGYYLDDYNNITPLHRLAPVVEPRVLRTAEDYENAPNGTVVHQGISGITHRKNCWVWKLYGVESVDSEDMAGTPRAVIWEPGDGA